MNTKKLHFLIAFLAYPITILSLIFGDYTIEELIEGISFSTIATVIYVGFVYLFFKNEGGQKIVMWGLLLIVTISIFFAITLAIA